MRGFLIFTSILTGITLGQTTTGPFFSTVNNSDVSASGAVNEYVLPGFDEDLGELIAVKITYDGVILNELGVEVFPDPYFAIEAGPVGTLEAIAGRGLFKMGVNSAGGNGFDSNQNPTAIWGDPSLFLLDGVGSSTIGALDVLSGEFIFPDGLIDFAGFSGASSGFQEVFRLQQSIILTDLFDLFRFEDETVSIFDFQAGTGKLSGTNAAARRVLSQGSGTVGVEYTYVAAPEPTAISLVILCAMAGLIRRKRL